MRSIRHLCAPGALLIALTLGGCAASPATTPATSAPPTPPSGLSAEDAAALRTLARVAPRTSTIDVASADWTECWLPSAHLIPAAEVADATTWKVICRIFWHQADGTQRYQDTNCIGDFAASPMLDHCYRWVHYDLEPTYEDHPGVHAGPPDA
ncbi:hypothetical protein DEU37_0402 [Microbacterium sp. AG790]|nr:hypothetical protein DEU37_0402 [Microbacterium sp. AG790]